ncbi:MAG TPA: aminoglycoside phosphotransferase family protein [Thermomicrobiales bacterium]|nr:aminoglycoside phosphotransferase family protein [Thermomicrobiales bacterium]
MTTITIGEQGETLTLSNELVSNLREVHGPKVDPWLAGLGPTLTGILEELDARVMPGKPPLSYHLVFFAERSTGEEIVVKCTVPNDEQPPEIVAVHGLSDAGIGPRLLWSDLNRGALVMERVRPGHILPTEMPTLEDDAEITSRIARLARRMAGDVDVDRWRHQLIPVRHYSRALEAVGAGTSLWQRHREDVERALAIRNELLAEDDARDVFLHGDLHHYNVLNQGAEGWCVIDPKGLVGPAGYEFGALTYNPAGIQRHPDLAGILRQRVEIWSDISGLPWEAVRSWGYVAAVLSACWSGEGGGLGWEDAMTVATTLRDLEPAIS